MIKQITSSLSLFTSLGTLVCCAIPALLVTLGLGASLAGLVGIFPQIIWLSEYKIWIFGVGGLLLIAAGILQWRVKNLACPNDAAKAEACQSTRGWSFKIYLLAVFLYSMGGFFAYLLPWFLN